MLRTRLRSLQKSTTSRYVSIGLFVYVVELLVIVIAQHFGSSPTVAVAFSFWIGLLISFFLQKIVTFRDKRMHHKVLLPQIIAVSLLVVFNFGFTIEVTRLLKDHIPAVGTRTIALGVTTLWNFYLYRTRIFKSQDTHLID
jgi:putative flippase GtrA